MLDLHSYKTRLESAKKCLLKCELSQKNKDTIWEFHEYLFMNGVTVPRVLKYLEKLRRIGIWLDKDFDKVTKKDIEKIIMHIQSQDWSMSTKIDYNIIIKRFYKWLMGNDEEYPEQVKWLKTTLRLKDKPVPSQSDLITEDEIKKLIEAAEHPRDKAFISIIYESGCRVGEIANLKIGNILFDQHGCVLNVNGKTGPRRIRVVNSTSYLTRWMDIHPFKKDREKPLWINFGQVNRQQQMQYNTIRVMIRSLFDKAGIKKRCNPHIFRHSRATFLANHLTEAQMKAYFGWVQHSDMASTYVHLSGRDTDKAILEVNGLTQKRIVEEVKIKPKKCPKCGFINSDESNYCSRCSSVLDIETAMELQKKLLQSDSKNQNVGNLMSALMEDTEFKEVLFKKIAEMKLGTQINSL